MFSLSCFTCLFPHTYMSINFGHRRISVPLWRACWPIGNLWSSKGAKSIWLSLLNASRYNVALRDVSFLHLLFLCLSLSSLPFTFFLLYLSFVRALHEHIRKSRKCTRTCAYARRLNTYERLTRIERSTRPNYFKLSYNRIKLPIIGDCIA